MRRVLILLLAATGWAQGRQSPVAEQVRLKGTAGAGYIQKDFLDTLGSGYWEEFGGKRADELFKHLQKRDLKANDVQRFLNGLFTKSEYRSQFGTRRGEVERMQTLVDFAVAEKDKKLFFGMVIATMVVTHKQDPTGEFCKQVAATYSAVDAKQTAKLLSGNVSKNTIRDIFKFRHKADLKLMQRILNDARESTYVRHPLARSLARRGGMRKGNRDDFDAAGFPKLVRGMPGFGGEFAGGTAGGLPFDKKLPACPYFGDELEELFKNLQ